MADNPFITTVEELEDCLSAPPPGAVEALAGLEGDLLLLGAGGKMGPSLARMARRASDAAGRRRRVIAVSRFGAGAAEARLRDHGIETVRRDLLDPAALAALPEAANVVWMAGFKFGAAADPSLAWAMNAWLPGAVCQRYSASRIVAFSTGNVYGLAPLAGGGSAEDDPPRPVGEYAQSCLGRERVFEHFSRTLGVPVALLRLNYACELRYGVLADVARKLAAGEPIDLGMGHFNALWQGDANAWALQALAHTSAPPRVLNLAGPELLSVRRVAEDLGRLLGRPPGFRGAELPDAILSNSQRAVRLFGYPRVGVRQMMEWVAHWVRVGGPSLDRPTHFEVRDGQF
ncbi:MAG TPA: NAD-dependent epimerase/dehydratase family protein [Gemmataceae bacterium]|nr:NAD-dependent epimerase/dehydratase family protein [Gemmataceae bacterium]